MRICRKCLLEKSLSEFYRRKSGERASKYYSKCKLCMKVRGRDYYHKNHDRQLALALLRRKKSYHLKRAVINKLKEKPCADCKRSYPYYAMDFDHNTKQDKLGDIAHMLSFSIETIKKEISKCDLVCANCHRIRTFKNAEVA